MNIIIWMMMGMAGILVLTIVVTVLYLRDLRRLKERDRVIKSLRRQLDHLLGTRYQAPPAEYKQKTKGAEAFYDLPDTPQHHSAAGARNEKN